MPDIENVQIKAKAEGTCAGGMHPEPPLDAYPLLAWTKHHPLHGYMVVHTEDQRASVADIAIAHAELGSLEAVASRFGTSVDHADQAVRYADEWHKASAK